MRFYLVAVLRLLLWRKLYRTGGEYVVGEKSYSIDELRELKALSNSNVEIIGNVAFEPTHGYVAAPSRHSSVKRGRTALWVIAGGLVENLVYELGRRRR